MQKSSSKIASFSSHEVWKRVCFSLVLLFSSSFSVAQTIELKPIRSISLQQVYTGVTVSASGEIFLFSESASRIDKMDEEGRVLSSFGGKGSGPQFLNEPKSVWVANDLNVYVADYKNNRITLLTRELGLISITSGRNPQHPDMAFGYPVFMALLPNNDWMVVDQENRNLIRMNLQFGSIFRYGGIEAGSFQLIQPESAVYGEREIAIFDGADSLYKVFDWYGNPVRKIVTGKGSLFSFRNMWWKLSANTLAPVDKTSEFESFDFNWLTPDPIRDFAFRTNRIYVLTDSILLILSLKPN